MARPGSGTRRPRAKTTGSGKTPAAEEATVAGTDPSTSDTGQPTDAPTRKPTRKTETQKSVTPVQPEQDTGAAAPEAPPETAAPEASDPATTPPEAAQAAHAPEASTASTDTPPDQSAAPEPDEPAKPASDPPSPTPERRGGLVPLVLGGVIAAAIGAGAALYLFPQGWQPTDTSALQTRLSALESRDSGADLAPLADRLDALEAAMPDLQPIENRLDALEAREPGTDAAALEERIRELEGTLAQRIEAEIAGALEAARDGQTEQALAIATAQQDLERTQVRMEARAALTQLAAAAESGQPAPDALPPLAAVTDLPPALENFRTGLPELRALQSSFTFAARDALAAAPVDDEISATERVMRFLRTQTGARSLVPREGDDTDAILSRAEAHLRAADLSATLAELNALPDAPAAAMADWRQQAEARQAALSALAEVQARIDSQ
ncbi:MAG: hypothetical protein JJU15_01650 [Pararhodobacter sp.]|nr:hypothetical protein [Pararhodobacter sp.]